MKKDCYLHLNHLPLLRNEYVNEAINSNFVNTVPTGNAVDIKNKFNRWLSSKSAYSSFQETKFCKDLSSAFGAIEAHYVRFDPCSLYDWHTDTQRQCAINFLLQPVSNALTLFKYSEITKEHSLVYSLDQCEYVPLVPVLFNTTVDHCVINLGNEPRYLLSVSFPRTITFYHVREFLKNYTTDAY